VLTPNYRIFEIPCWTSSSKIYSPSFHGIHKIVTFKHQSFFFLDMFYSERIPLKFMKIRWYISFLGSFAHHVYIMLSTHGSDFNFRFVNTNEVEFSFQEGSSPKITISWTLYTFIKKNIFHIISNWSVTH
jgi:hypothetical protein